MHFPVYICNHQNELLAKKRKKKFQLPNVLFVMIKDFPSCSNLRAVVFCLQWWLGQVLIALTHLPSSAVRAFLVFVLLVYVRTVMF